MSAKQYLHELSDFGVLIERVQREYKNVLPQLIEKDYWIMHCLWGLKEQGFSFELKGGTSLSKGFGIIDRFSEDIDIRIEPPVFLDVKIGKNQAKPKQIESRFKFYDWIADEINITGVVAERDPSFDDEKARSGGVRLTYDSLYSQLEGIKPYVLLEVGFDVTTPHEQRVISSWAYDFAENLALDIVDNRPRDIPCYLPGYTFVEKLSAISVIYRQENAGKTMPINFIRHYYDIYKLLEDKTVLAFIDTAAYREHKAKRFRQADELSLQKNEAFLLRDKATRDRYREEYQKTQALYYDDFPAFDAILERIRGYLERL